MSWDFHRMKIDFHMIFKWTTIKTLHGILTLATHRAILAPLRVRALPVGVVVLILRGLPLQYLDVHATDLLAVQCVHRMLGAVTVSVLSKAIVLPCRILSTSH